jgi:hypothetical protein
MVPGSAVMDSGIFVLQGAEHGHFLCFTSTAHKTVYCAVASTREIQRRLVFRVVLDLSCVLYHGNLLRASTLYSTTVLWLASGLLFPCRS